MKSQGSGYSSDTLTPGFLCYYHKWSRWSDSNRRPAVYETAALPLSYTGTRLYCSIERVVVQAGPKAVTLDNLCAACYHFKRSAGVAQWLERTTHNR